MWLWIVVFYWLVLVILTATVASSARGRSWFGWFLIALLISPLVALLVLGLLDNLSAISQSESAVSGGRRVKRCPACAEDIMFEAAVCKHCGVAQAEPEVETDEQAAERLGVRRDSGQYIYGAYRYNDLADALAEARRASGEAVQG